MEIKCEQNEKISNMVGNGVREGMYTSKTLHFVTSETYSLLCRSYLLNLMEIRASLKSIILGLPLEVDILRPVLLLTFILMPLAIL